MAKRQKGKGKRRVPTRKGGKPSERRDESVSKWNSSTRPARKVLIQKRGE